MTIPVQDFIYLTLQNERRGYNTLLTLDPPYLLTDEQKLSILLFLIPQQDLD
jgi:hypothetical protein